MNHLLLFLSFLASRLLIEADPKGFSVEIFHRDSKMSPFYNPSITPEELAVNAAIDSTARANHFAYAINGSKFSLPMTKTGPSYLFKFFIGTPPLEGMGQLDTGSGLAWMQCKPCKKCQPQNLPIYDPSKSTTYKKLPCSSKYCTSLRSAGCDKKANKCVYIYAYGTGLETTEGVMSTDTLSLSSSTGQNHPFPNIAFGCGNENELRFHGVETGIIGFSRQETSLVSQLGSAVQNRFAYCLILSSSSIPGKLKFGADAVLSGPGTVSTPLLTNNANTHGFYYINFEGISIGNVRIAYNLPTTGGSAGNMFIDSGTTITKLEPSFYAKVEAALLKAIPLTPNNPPIAPFKVCYAKKAISTIPYLKVVYHFTGADITLRSYNAFYDAGTVVCFAAVPGPVNIYGNTAQINFAVSYDLGNNKLSFAPLSDCSKF